jgi:hypothetical protein
MTLMTMNCRGYLKAVQHTFRKRVIACRTGRLGAQTRQSATQARNPRLSTHLPGHPLFLVEFTVPLGFEGPAANSEFMRRVTDGARTRDLRSHYQSNAYSESGSTCLGWWPRTLSA